MMLLILLSSTMISACFWGLFQTQRAYNKKLNLLQTELDEYQKEAQVLRKADMSIQYLIKKINQDIQDLDNSLKKLTQNQQASNSYQQALKLFEMGANLSEVLSSCHLSQAEAELLQNLHVYKNSIHSNLTEA